MSSWRKQPGDWVEADEIVCDITTDKIDTELPSPASGRLVEILVAENETVAVGTPLAQHRHRRAAGRSPIGWKATGSAEAKPADAPDRSHVISPVVRRVADEHGVDLEQVTGTGIGGRIRKKDVLALVEGKPPPERPLHTESPYRPEPEPEPASRLRPPRHRRAWGTADAAHADPPPDRRAHGAQPAAPRRT